MFELSRAKQLLLVAILALSASACSSLPDWANPDTWGDSSEPATATADSSGAPDQPSQGATVAEASDKYPVLADTPSKAPPNTSTDEQKQVADALVADRAQAQYSSEQLRAGTEASAAPPPTAAAEASTATSAPGAAAASVAPPSPTQASPPPASAPAAPPPPTSHVAVATPPAPPPPPAPAAPSGNAAFGFQPSHAPALDPRVAQIVGSSGRTRLAMSTSAAAAAYGPPAASVVLGNGNAVDANGMGQVKAAVAAFQAKGGAGFVRVVGHASGGTSAAQALERAQSCATVIARALMKLGVPAKKVLVEASGSADGEPRHADIYIQS